MDEPVAGRDVLIFFFTRSIDLALQPAWYNGYQPVERRGVFFPYFFFFFACIRRTIGDSFSIFFYDPQKNHDPVSDRLGTSAATCIVRKISDKCFLLLYHTANVFFFHSKYFSPSPPSRKKFILGFIL